MSHWLYESTVQSTVPWSLDKMLRHSLSCFTVLATWTALWSSRPLSKWRRNDAKTFYETQESAKFRSTQSTFLYFEKSRNGLELFGSFGWCVNSPHFYRNSINGSIPGSVTRLGDFCTLGNHSKLGATIILPKSSTLLYNFCKGVKIIHFF